MTREEDLIRSTTRAIAATVREVPPLQLASATDELGSPARAQRRGRGRPRRWWSWGAPLTAAAVVAALAVALALVKGIPNGSAVPENPTPSKTASTGPDGVPRYYVALKDLAGNVDSNTRRNEIVVGDSLTGKTLATFAPPARTVFESVSAAADDRTFVVFGVTSSSGSFQAPSKGATVAGSWYEVRLAPGTAEPASLTRLPIKPQTVPGYYYKAVSGSYVVPPLHAVVGSYGPVLSASGQELAVPEWAPHWLAVKVFSVATGQLLHDWTTSALSFDREPSLAWIDGDQELALVTHSHLVQPNSKSGVTKATVREWPVAGQASGDLAADSKVVWDVQAGNSHSSLTTVQSCVTPMGTGPVLISADGKTFTCATIAGLVPEDHLRFVTYPLAASTTATAKGRVDYQVTLTKKQGTYIPAVLWTSPSGGTLIGALIPSDGSPAAVANGLHIGVISHGKFTPLRIPASLTASTVSDVTF